jgi:NAD(P)-dependent dehydrogenase (short-subunit alcohol dehydrogenase family)
MNNQELLDYVPAKDLLKDRVILVTGASDGVGKEVAKTYAQYGATVVLLSKTIKKLEAVYDEIMAMGAPKPAIYPMHLEGANAHDYEKMAEVIEQELGQLNGIVLNAGWLPGYTPLKHYDVEMWSKVLTTNLHANFLIVKSCLPLLEKSNNAAVIFSSHAASEAYNGGYGVAKAGSDALLKIMAEEYEDNPFIRVNGIDTGPIRTYLRTYHFPAENPNTLAEAKAVVGPYLYFMGADSKQQTGQIVRFDRLPADASWPGELTKSN